MIENRGTSIEDIICDLQSTINDFHNIGKNISNENHTWILLKSKLPYNRMHEISKNLNKNLQLIKQVVIQCTLLGKTSNGKSSVINAILGDQVLPSARGRTTSCFISVKGCDKDDGYFYDDKQEIHELEKLKIFANEMKSNKKETDKESDKNKRCGLMEMFYPKSKCPLLNHNIQFMDIPGVDFSVNIDKEIEQYFTATDMFVYVIDSEATVSDVERAFFTRYYSNVAVPKVFVLMNKWDRCLQDSSKTELDELKEQHTKTVNDFLRSFQRNQETVVDIPYFISATDMFKKESETSKETRGEFGKFMKALEKYIVEMKDNKLSAHFDQVDQYLNEIISEIDTHLRRHRQEHAAFGTMNLDEWIGAMFLEWKELLIIDVEMLCARLEIAKWRPDEEGLAEFSIVEEQIFDWIKKEMLKIRKKLFNFLSGINKDMGDRYMSDFSHYDELSSVMPATYCIMAVKSVIESFTSLQTDENLDDKIVTEINRFVDNSELSVKKEIRFQLNMINTHLTETDVTAISELTKMKKRCMRNKAEIPGHLMRTET